MTVRLRSFSKMKLTNLRRLASQVGLVLVSGSPRRRQILTEAGIPFEIVIPEVKETIRTDMEPSQQAVELAMQKVNSGGKNDSKVYLGCDTIVVLEEEILGKPADEADAMRMLKKLSGKTHLVVTALVLYDAKNRAIFSGMEKSLVRFNRLDEKSLKKYVESGEPLDKAGSYGIQGMGRFLVDSVEGSIDNVIGLPMDELERLSGQFWKQYV